MLKPREGEGTPSFEEIYREYGERVLNLLYRFTSREQVARDLLQDVFIKVYEHMDSFENRSQIYTWIYRIAVNHALNYLKRERRNLWFNLMDETVGELLTKEKIDAPGLGTGDVLRPDQLLEDKQREQFTQQAIDALHPNYRIPFVLFKDEHLSYDEIAKMLNISHSAVETRIHRARKTLIKRLRPLFR
jgi:RNA polymerase sigma-70 factor (ECF subfamily)